MYTSSKPSISLETFFGNPPTHTIFKIFQLFENVHVGQKHTYVSFILLTTKKKSVHLQTLRLK